MRLTARGRGGPRVGLFGDLGMGNIGNDASMEAVLSYLRAEQPEAVVDAMCAGPAAVRDRYGVPAVPMSWYRFAAPGPVAAALKVLGKGIDAFRMARWVGRHDAVIVPGMGIFETSLPLRAWGLPYALFAVGVSGRLLRTKVAYVSVGAGQVNQAVTGWLLRRAARLAAYRSYRDEDSRAAMTRWGLDTSADPVYPDLAFALPVPAAAGPGDPRLVCVGVMDYRGSNDDRSRADEIRASYVGEMTRFVRRLLDDGRSVRLVVGDTNGSDACVVREIVTAVRNVMPDLDPARLAAPAVHSLEDILRAMAPAGSAVVTRFHNVVAAVMLGKPVIAISYASKHDSLMAGSGLAEFCHPVRSLDHERLFRQLTELEGRSAQLRRTLADRKAVSEKLLGDQFIGVWEALAGRRTS